MFLTSSIYSQQTVSNSCEYIGHLFSINLFFRYFPFFFAAILPQVIIVQNLSQTEFSLYMEL